MRRPSLGAHLVLDNYSTHKNGDHPQLAHQTTAIPAHFTPTHGSWLNLVERWFAELIHKRIRRGAFRSVRELQTRFASSSKSLSGPEPQIRFWTALPGMHAVPSLLILDSN
jgi:transposase